MSLFDIAMMAMHNLWTRRLRTVLNILGVVLASVVLAMMLAGTKGVSEGFDRMINDSEEVRRFAIYRSWQRNEEVPEEAIRIEGDVSPERRARLRKRRRNNWLRDNASRVPLDAEQLAFLKALPHLQEVRPIVRLNCKIGVGDAQIDGGGRVAGLDRQSRKRLIAGEYLQADDAEGVLLGEFAAYRLGYISDAQVEELVGRPLSLKVRVGEPRITQLKRLMESDLASLTKSGASLNAMRRLVQAVDMTSLSDRDKELLRSVFSEKTTSTSSAEFIDREFTIRGVVRDSEEGEGMSLFDFVGSGSGSDIYLAASEAAELETQKENFNSFQGVIGVVDRVQNLGELTEQIEAAGFRVQSSLRLLTRIDEEIGRARLAIGALSLLILLISAIGISNTMVVSVLERTRELGILKAVGAQDRHVLLLMLLEGALTGVIGAGVAILLSLGLAQGIAIWVRHYITNRIGESFDASVFAFGWFDLLMVMTLAVVVCTLASVFPAWRAAKLDPVVAMRGN